MTRTDRKPVGDMTREELIELQGQLSRQLRDVKLLIDTAKRRARADGVYMPPDELAALERRRGSLVGFMQKAAGELTRRRTQRQQGGSFQHWFTEAARELLDPEFFERVTEHAHALANKHAEA